MSTKLDIEEFHLQSETAEDVIKVYQECHLGDFINEGKKNSPPAPTYVKGPAIVLVCSIIIYIVDISN